VVGASRDAWRFDNRAAVRGQTGERGYSRFRRSRRKNHKGKKRGREERRNERKRRANSVVADSVMNTEKQTASTYSPERR